MVPSNQSRRKRDAGTGFPAFPVYPFNAGCLPLNYSGNPGADGVSYRGANGTRWAKEVERYVGYFQLPFYHTVLNGRPLVFVLDGARDNRTVNGNTARFPFTPLDYTDFLPLSYSVNPGVNGVSYRGVNGNRWA